MNKGISVVLLTLAMMAISFTQNTPAQTGAAVGHWRLNLQQSSWGQMPPPKSGDLVVTADQPDSLKWHATIVQADGKQLAISYDGAVDGTPHPIQGSPEGEMISYTNENGVVHGTGKTSKGMETHLTVAMSPDHKTMTLKNSATTPSGNVEWTEVWERTE